MTFLRALQYYWIVAQGYRLHPWDSPYLRWRLETFLGPEAAGMTAANFFHLSWKYRAQMKRFVNWAAERRRITSGPNFGEQLLLCVLIAIILYLITLVYLQSVGGESNPGLTASKILVVFFLFVVSNVAQIFITIRSPKTGFLSIFSINLGIWLSFFVFLSIDAVTFHTGLAKDAAAGPQEFVGFFLRYFSVLGIPCVVLNTLLGAVVVPRAKSFMPRPG